MPQRSTYYTEQELEALEHLAERNDESFSGIVRQAVQAQYNIESVMDND